MNRLRVSSLRWAVGVFCAVLGAMMLVVPHRISSPAFAPLQFRISIWGALFMVAGFALVCTALLTARRRIILLLHAIAGLLMLAMTVGFFLAGGWTGFIGYLVFGLGTLAAGWVRDEDSDRAPGPRMDVLALLAAIDSLLIGAFLLLFPSQLDTPALRPLMPYRTAFELAFLGGGLAVIAAQWGMMRANPLRLAAWPAHLFLAAVFFAFLLAGSAPIHSWTGYLFYSVFGVTLAAIPWLGPHLESIRRDRFHSQLALLFGLAASIPLIAVAAIAGRQEEQEIRSNTLDREETLAVGMARGLANYLQLHRSALTTLAGQPGLMELSSETQATLLATYHKTYPDMLGFVLFAQGGRPIAHIHDEGTTLPIADTYRVDRVAPRTGQPSMKAIFSPALHRPIIRFDAALFDGEGRWAGQASAVLESAQITDFLKNLGDPEGTVIYLVDERGRAVAHPNAQLLASETSTDLSRTSPVAALLSARNASGTTAYFTPRGEQLAAYADVPGLNWGVVVERAAASPLITSKRAREVIFQLLLGFLVAGAVVATVLARRVMFPLRNLTLATEALEEGWAATPLPASRIFEVAYLAGAFGRMRDRLAARTRAREKVQEELRQANAELEARVTARTAELEDANDQLRVELAERRKAEDAVRQSEAKFRAIYDSNTIPIAFWHADGRILEANSAFLNLIQFSRMELEAGAIRWDRLTPAEHLYRDLRAHRQLQAGRSIPPYEKEFVLRDGSRVPVLMGSVLLPEHTDQGISFAIDLTERQRAEAAVRRGEERERSRAREIEALMEAMPAAVWVAHDPLCARVTGNRAAYEMLRMDRGANMSLTAPDAERPKHFRLRHEGKSIPIDDLPVQIAAMKGIEVRDYEFEIAFADGALHHFLGNAAPLLDEAGRPRGAIAAFVDITERRRAQEARERLMAIIEATPDMVSSATLDGRVLYLNKAARDAFGMAEEGDLTNWTISKEHPEWANRLIEEEGLPAALARGVWQGEMAVLDREGREIPVSQVIVSHKGPEGRVDRLSMIARDISVRIQLMEAAERRAREAEEGRHALRRIEWLLTKSAQGGNGKGAIERLPRQPYGNLVELNTSRLLVDAVGEEVLAEIVADSLDLLETSAAIYEKNGDYALGLFTSGWCRRLDAASRALCATDDNRAALASDRWHCHQSCWESASKQAVESGEPVDVECRGGMRIFSVPIHAGGEVVGALNFGYGDPPRDPEALGAIAERYGLDCDELRQLSLAYESRPPFIIEVAKNRLKTSANLIGAIVEQKLAERRIRELNADLERSIADLRQVNWDLEMFNYSVSHMLQTTLSVIHGYADLLTEEHGERLGDDGRKFADVIRANAEKTEQIIVGLLSLSHIGRQEIRPETLDLKPIVREAMGDLRLPPEQTPELAIGSLPACLGDRGMLRQVLDALLGNAAKFSRKNPRARIEVGGRPEGDWNLYWVRDNGVGFSMRYVDRLFRAFQRLHREEEFEGTGLGLTAARRIVERHGGRIRAEAQPGQGATFYFTLPKA